MEKLTEKDGRIVCAMKGVIKDENSKKKNGRYELFNNYNERYGYFMLILLY